MAVYFRHLTCHSPPFDPTVVSNQNFSDAGCLGFRHDMKPENSFIFRNIHSFPDFGAAKMGHYAIHISAEHYSNTNPNHNTALPWEAGEEYGFQEETNDAESQLHGWSLYTARLDSRIGGMHFSLKGSAHGIENDEKALVFTLGNGIGRMCRQRRPNLDTEIYRVRHAYQHIYICPAIAPASSTSASRTSSSISTATVTPGQLSCPVECNLSDPTSFPRSFRTLLHRRRVMLCRQFVLLLRRSESVKVH